MKITITQPGGAEVRVSPISRRRYPDGWSGEVPDDQASTLIAAKQAVPVVDAPELTADEQRVLKEAAADVLRRQAEGADTEADDAGDDSAPAAGDSAAAAAGAAAALATPPKAGRRAAAKKG